MLLTGALYEPVFKIISDFLGVFIWGVGKSVGVIGFGYFQ